MVMAAGLGVGGSIAAVAVPDVHLWERALSSAVVPFPVCPVRHGKAGRYYLAGTKKPRPFGWGFIIYARETPAFMPGRMSTSDSRSSGCWFMADGLLT